LPAVVIYYANFPSPDPFINPGAFCGSKTSLSDKPTSAAALSGLSARTLQQDRGKKYSTVVLSDHSAGHWTCNCHNGGPLRRRTAFIRCSDWPAGREEIWAGKPWPQRVYSRERVDASGL